MQNSSKLFSPLIIIVFFFASLFLYTKLFGPIPFFINSVTTTKTDTFVVSGEGKSVIKPDIAYATVGIEASGTSVKQTQNQINTVINKVSEGLKALGVNEEDIKTTNYNINPTFDWTNGKQRITGFSANTNLQIKIRDIDKINEVIDSSTTNGANQIGGISFDVEDKTKAEDEARKMAVAEAKKKAQDAAQIAGFKLGKIINYSEGGINPPAVMLSSMKVRDAAGGGAPATEIQTGSSEIKLTVTLSYQIE
ncbi:MAG: SIMPL domain-containing protein [Patescibacteria group bacterium]|nr:SIMPL domain-containing protein [Patescibacteria group bacterium]